MALDAKYDLGLGDQALHFSIANYQPNMRTKAVAGRLEIYASKARRDARKAADIALVTLNAQVASAVSTRDTANEEYKAQQATAQQAVDALTDAYNAKTEAKKLEGKDAYEVATQAANAAIDARRTAHETTMLTAHKAIEALKGQQAEQTATYRANAPFKDPLTFEIPPGGVVIAQDGSVSLPAIYTWLAGNDLAGGVQDQP